MEFRWDLHYLKESNGGLERCSATDEDHRCEYILHAGEGHSAQDGSHQWIAQEGAGEWAEWAEIPEWIRGAV